ncbi:hypothetical protein AAFC00_003025 [Neodothiora populina]|uniref:DNA-directed RNA polymerase subunit n=1 Tax=Neodothiora populina TaxID=2781224 RepID=A0ABR3P915_9PEZI
MATTLETTPKAATKSSKSKDSSSSKKSSKKRSREEQQLLKKEDVVVEAQEQEEAQQAIPSSPSKRQRLDNDNDVDMDVDPTPSAPVESGAYMPTDEDIEKKSPFLQQTTSLYLALSPVAHRFPLQGLCAEHLSPLLLTYYPPLNGVLLSYSNPRLTCTPHDPAIFSSSAAAAPAKKSSSKKATPSADEPATLPMAKSIAEYAPSYIWLTADFVLLRPTKGSCIEGHISLQNESYLGLVCYNFFNAGIPRARLPRDWTWVSLSSSSAAAASKKDNTISGASADWMRGKSKHSAEDEQDGHFVDAEGNEIKGSLRFRVKDFESAPSTERERGFLSIEGTLLDDVEDAKVDAEEKVKARGKGKGRSGGRR